MNECWRLGGTTRERRRDYEGLGFGLYCAGSSWFHAILHPSFLRSRAHLDWKLSACLLSPICRRNRRRSERKALDGRWFRLVRIHGFVFRDGGERTTCVVRKSRETTTWFSTDCWEERSDVPERVLRSTHCESKISGDAEERHLHDRLYYKC